MPESHYLPPLQRVSDNLVTKRVEVDTTLEIERVYKTKSGNAGCKETRYGLFMSEEIELTLLAQTTEEAFSVKSGLAPEPA